jgi:hypothetical protein
MKVRTRNLAILSALAVGLSGVGVYAADGTRDFTHYQVIIDRAPFGQMNAADAAAAQPSFSTRFTFMGTAKPGEDQPWLAIIFDKEKNQMHFLKDGDTIGPVSVVKIERPDKGPAKLVLKQGLEQATLMLEAKAGGAAPPPAGAAPAPQPGQPLRPMPIPPGARRIPFQRGG